MKNNNIIDSNNCHTFLMWRLCPQELGGDGCVKFVIRGLDSHRQRIIAVLLLMKRLDVVV